MKTTIVWFRNDLRIHDHPALATAIEDADTIVPLFIFDDVQLSGRHRGSNRNRFLIESLKELKKSLNTLGGDLVIRHGTPDAVLPAVIKQTNASAVYYTADYTPYSLKRDKSVKSLLDSLNVSFRGFPGRLIVHGLDDLRTGNGNIYKVFTPFFKNWLLVQRRELADTPKRISLPTVSDTGKLPSVSDITVSDDLSPKVLPGGEIHGRRHLDDFIEHRMHDYKHLHNDMAADGTSKISPYLHFGCLSPLEIENRILHDTSEGPSAWRRQLAWREFYNYILYHFPANAKQEFQERYRSLGWNEDEGLLHAWQKGLTGYPLVDAAMRQLREEGWMHNRGRLVVGSFLTKDLGIDWRKGETYFMRMLMDGDQANNNGNWQWITSVGVDPAPVFRRIYNPSSQQASHDPTGGYVRRYVPELSKVPDKYIAEPWKMPEEVQKSSGCIIGKDYPAPIIDHKEARHAALEQFRAAAAAYK